MAIYTIYPQQNWSLGRFEFTKSILEFPETEEGQADEKDFLAELSQCSRDIQIRVVRISEEKAGDVRHAVSKGQTESVRIVQTNKPLFNEMRPSLNLTGIVPAKPSE